MSHDETKYVNFKRKGLIPCTWHHVTDFMFEDDQGKKKQKKKTKTKILNDFGKAKLSEKGKVIISQIKGCDKYCT